MAIKLTPESFLNLVKESGLIEPEVLNRHLDEMKAAGVSLDKSRFIADELVARKLLTRWQAEKLQQGKHKGFFIGRYRLLSLLGKGGMSSVYLAEHVLMRRRCAIKVLPAKRVQDSSYLERFHREAQAVASLDHPNIVRAYDVDKEVDKDAEIHYLVMEYVNGKSLQDIVQEHGPMDLIPAAEYVRQSAEGLAHAHSVGMVHRDIKPGNLLVDQSFTVKLLDLGLARLFDGDEEGEALTIRHDEKVLGTADYLAPEQAIDSHSVDARADIYSLGCTMYFLLTGHPPFTEGTLAQRLMCHQTKMPPPVEGERPEVPQDLLDILYKMIAKTPDDRYQSAQEIADALAAWLVDNGDDDWRARHPQLTGGSGISSQSNIAAAKPAQATPAQEAAPAADQADANLSSFLSNLDSGSPSGSAVSASAASTPTASAEPIAPPTAEPVRPAEPIRAAELVKQAQPVQPAKPAEPIKRAAPVKQAQPVPVAGPIEEAEPVDEAPVAEPAVAEPDDDDVPFAEAEPLEADVAEPLKSKLPLKLGSRKQQNQLMNFAIAAVVVLVVLWVGWALFGPSGSSSNAQGDANGQPAADANAGEQAASQKVENLGTQVTVGRSGNFRTIADALNYVINYQSSQFNVGDQPNFVIEVAGGEIFPESIAFDHSIDITSSELPRKLPRNVHLVSKGGQPAVLAPSGTEPVIRLNAVTHFTLEGFTIDASGKEVAVELKGNNLKTKLSRLTVSGFTSIGIHGVGTQGLVNNEIELQSIEFKPAAPQAVGVFLDESPTSSTMAVKLQRCRFWGPMEIGLQVHTSANSLNLTENVFVQNKQGLAFTGNSGHWQDVIVANNTFFECPEPIVFETMPGSHSSDLVFARNLFVGSSGPEAVVESGMNQQAMKSVIRGNGKGIEHNWSDRAAEKPAGSELDLFANSGKRGAELKLESVDPQNQRFLAPSADSKHKAVGQPPGGQKKYIGAVAP